MKAKLINDGPQSTWALVFDTGDEVIAGMTYFAKEKNLDASQITGLGAFSDAVLGFFDWDRKDYKRIPVREQVEVVSLIGDIAKAGHEPKLHIHAVVAKPDGTALGGHLLEAHVRPTLEIVITESPSHLRRRHDSETGLALIAL